MVWSLLLNRYTLGAIAALALIAGGYTWWSHHDVAEQKTGYQACTQLTTQTKADATLDTLEIEAAHAAQLKQVVDAYDAKINLQARNSADLAQRLHDSDAALRARTVSAMGSASGTVCASVDDTAARLRDQQYADTLTACAANTTELNALREAWIREAAKVRPAPQ